jgi:hypothetical protein
MGTIGVYASRFNVNTKSLEAFDEAIRFFKEKKTADPTETRIMIGKLLDVLNPLVESIKGNLSESIAISERNVVDIVKGRNNRNWPMYKNRIQELHSKLDSTKLELSENDFKLLNDIADALDAECATLYRRMSERE